MKDENKTKRQLINELRELRQQVAGLEARLPHGSESGRNRTEEELRASEARFRTIFNHSNDAIFVIDPVWDEILDANDRACSMLGFCREEILTLPISAIHPNEIPKLLTFAQSVAEHGHGWTNELTCLTREGQVLPAEISASMIDLAGRSCMVALVRDITKRKQARTAEKLHRQALQKAHDQLERRVEERTVELSKAISVLEEQIVERRRAEKELAEERNMLRTLIDNLPDFIFIKDRKSRLVISNTAHARLLGRTMPDGVVGQTDFDIFPQELARQYYTDEQEVMQTGQPLVNREEATIDSQGRKQWLLTTRVPLQDGQGEIVGLVGISRDITERKQAEETRQQYAERLRVLREIDQAILAARSSQETVQAALGHIRQLVPCQRVSLKLFDFEADEAIVFAVDVDGATHLGTEKRHVLADSRSVTGLRQGQESCIVEDILALDKLLPMDEQLLAEGMRSYMVVPLISQDEHIGALSLGATNPGTFVIEYADIAHEVADHLAIAVKRAQAEEALRHNERQLRHLNEQLEDHSRNLEQKVAERTHQIERRRRVAEGLREMVTILNSNRPLDEILDFIVAEASRLLGTQSGAIYRLQADQEMFTVQATRGLPTEYVADLTLPLDRSFLGQAVSSRRPVVVSLLASITLNEEIGLDRQRWAFLADHYRTLLAVPLIRQGGAEVSDEIYGGIVLHYPESRQFSAEDIGLAAAFGDQAALAIENARLRQRVEQAAVMEERSRLARELHDSVTQSLYSLTLLAEGWRRLAATGRLDAIADSLTELGEIAQQALKEMRLLVYELRPPALEKAGLLGALYERLGAVEKRAGVEARLIAEAVIELPVPVEEEFYRIAQEALNNALKHASATSMNVHIRAGDEWVELEVADNGRGFDPDTIGDRRGMGLVGMRERAEKLGGSLTISSTPGGGTSVKVRINRRRPND